MRADFAYAIERLDWLIGVSGVEYPGNWTAIVTTPSGVRQRVTFFPETGLAELTADSSSRGDVRLLKFGRYTPHSGWMLWPYFLDKRLHKLSPLNPDNIYGRVK